MHDESFQALAVYGDILLSKPLLDLISVGNIRCKLPTLEMFSPIFHKRKSVGTKWVLYGGWGTHSQCQVFSRTVAAWTLYSLPLSYSSSTGRQSIRQWIASLRLCNVIWSATAQSQSHHRVCNQWDWSCQCPKNSRLPPSQCSQSSWTAFQAKWNASTPWFPSSLDCSGQQQ